MKCGDLGHKTRTGKPCGQIIGPKAKGCLWHTRDAAGRKLLSMKGTIVARLKRALPKSYAIPEFVSPDSIKAFARELARLALTEDVDFRRLAEARGAAHLALAAISATNQERLIEALLTVERGGAAVLLLQQLQTSLVEGRRKPLPGRVLAATGEGDGT